MNYKDLSGQDDHKGSELYNLIGLNEETITQTVFCENYNAPSTQLIKNVSYHPSNRENLWLVNHNTVEKSIMQGKLRNISITETNFKSEHLSYVFWNINQSNILNKLLLIEKLESAGKKEPSSPLVFIVMNTTWLLQAQAYMYLDLYTSLTASAMLMVLKTLLIDFNYKTKKLLHLYIFYVVLLI